MWLVKKKLKNQLIFDEVVNACTKVRGMLFMDHLVYSTCD